ncbi:MAG TPA: hypothetical protein VK465_19000 [Fibrobacteria bacterium]|nr:hypothetical protein [Fibrobacteria bacterium]
MIEPMERMPDETCDICHQDASRCTCPACPVCGEVGCTKRYAEGHGAAPRDGGPA